MRIDVFHHTSDLAEKTRIDQILKIVTSLSCKMEDLMATLQDVQAEVAAQSTVIDSAIALLNGLEDAVAALTPNQEAIDALAAEIHAKTQALSDAVVENTPEATQG